MRRRKSLHGGYVRCGNRLHAYTDPGLHADNHDEHDLDDEHHVIDYDDDASPQTPKRSGVA